MNKDTKKVAEQILIQQQTLRLRTKYIENVEAQAAAEVESSRTVELQSRFKQI